MQSQPAFPVYHRRFANPAPLGLCGFALTTFMLSLINGEPHDFFPFSSESGGVMNRRGGHHVSGSR